MTSTEQQDEIKAAWFLCKTHGWINGDSRAELKDDHGDCDIYFESDKVYYDPRAHISRAMKEIERKQIETR